MTMYRIFDQNLDCNVELVELPKVPGEKPDMTDNVYWYKKVITYSKFQVENSNKGYYYCCDPGDPDIVITSTDQEFPYDTKEFVDFVYPPTPYDFEKIRYVFNSLK